VIGSAVGHYHILGKLGSGGMGEVFLAQDTKLDRKVALKVLRADVASDRDHVRRFIREAKAASAISHPNVCVVHEVGESDDGRLFIAMEHIHGATLESTLNSRALDPRELLDIAIQVGDALDEAHSKGITHRDIKPANIMVTARGQAKVLDFGLAKRRVPQDDADSTATVTRDVTANGAVLGTVHYMSPEQALGKDVDHRSDLFSFGIVLYQMATRRRPFGGAGPIETIDQIIHAVPEALPPAGREIPQGLDRVVRRCLEKDRERRYQSTHELVEDLKTLRRELETPRPIVSPLAPAVPARRVRRIAYWAVAVSASAVLGLVAYVSVWQNKRPDTDAAKPPAVPVARLSDGAPASAKPEANEYYEKALLFLRARYSVPRAIEMFDRALQLDPHFAEARAYHAFAQFCLIDGGYANDGGLLYKAEEETRQALTEDPRSAMGLSARAAILLYQGRKELVPGEAKTALQVNPGSADAKIWLVNYHQLNGDYGAGEALAREVLESEPLYFPARMNLAELRRQQGDFADAIRQLEKILEQDPENIYAIVKLARAYGELGDLRRARLVLESARPELRRNFQVRLGWAVQFALEGQRTKALKEMDPEVLKYATLVPHLTSRVAEFYAVLHDVPRALEWLDTALRNGDERAEWFGRDSLLASVRNEPRFEQILDSISLRRQSRAKGAGR
jgi:tetratricopeptide (TPR) repeat protein/tRNA A-37 threonylcarbamoyl transferase component Bud32